MPRRKLPSFSIVVLTLCNVMQTLLTVSVVLMLLIALLYGNILANEKSQGKKKKAQTVQQKLTQTKKKTIEKSDVHPIDLACTMLPKNYIGHDLKNIYEALEARDESSKKGEYETTEQYKQRIQDEEDKPLIGQLRLNDIFSLVVNPESKYNADSKTLTLMVKAGNVMNGVHEFDRSRVRIDGPTLYYDKSTYIGSNAYGASIEVTKIVNFQVVLAFSNKSVLPLNKTTEEAETFEFALGDISPESAKVIRQQLRVAFIYKLEKPYLSEGALLREPTRDWPRDNFFKYHNVLAQLKAVWIFNQANGEILLKVKTETSRQENQKEG